MTFDSLTLAAVRDELQATLAGGQVQRVLLATPLTVGLEVYRERQRHFLLCSAEPLAARVCLAEERPVRDSDTPTPLLLLLRKYVREGRLLAFEQPPYERLLKLRIGKRDAEGRFVEVSLIIETMGRRSNVVLVGPDGLILDALRRVGPTRNPRRPVLPRRPYVEPPAQNRLDPLDPTSYDVLRTMSAPPGTSLAAQLASKLAGFSPLAASEAAHQACGDAAAPADHADWSAVEGAVRNLLAPLTSHRWSPTICWDEDQQVAFAPYELTHLARFQPRPLDSISRVVEIGFSRANAPRPAAPANRVLLAAIEQRRDQLERRLAGLRRELESAETVEGLRRAGEGILANLAAIQPGQELLEFDGQRIDLDVMAAPLENAERYFRQYRKARDAGRQVPELVATTELQQRQLEELRVMAEVADSPARQRALREELGLAPVRSDPAPRHKPGRPDKPGRTEGQVLRRRTLEGLEVLVGTSGRGNETVTFKLGGANDLWLHARGVPGAHVILKTGGQEPSTDSLTFAARLAAQNSQARSARRVEVDYTSRKHVRKIPAAPPGLVTYSREQTLAVELD